MMYPLVRELAADGIPVAVTCRVLKIARQPYYRWLADPVTDAELEAAYLANALFDAHRDDPEFGYRYLADEARDAGHTACDRTAWRICSANGWWSAFGKKRGKNGKPGSPVHDDLVERDFTANRPNQLWLADITEHKTAEGKLYLCAIKDVHSNRIVGYSIDSFDEVPPGRRRLAQRCREARTDRRLHPAHRPRISDPGSSSGLCTDTTWSARWAASAPPATTRPWRASSHYCRRTSWTAVAGPLARSCGWRSWSGSNAPITGGDAKPRSGD